MRRLSFFILLIWSIVLGGHAQSKVYVIFTSSKVETKGVWNSEFERNASVRDTIHLFTLFDRADGNYDEGYFYRFIYKNEKSKPNKPYFFLSITDLKQGVEIDWDKVSGKADAEVKYRSILSYDEIYFVDRTESTSSRLKVYPVKLLELKKY